MSHNVTCTSLIDLISNACELFPSKVAYTYLRDGEFLEAAISYQELHEKCCSFALFLRDQNISQRNILLAYPPGIDFIVAFFGALYGGFIPIPIVPPKSSRNFELFKNIQIDSQSEVILSCGSLAVDISQAIRNFAGDKNKPKNFIGNNDLDCEINCRVIDTDKINIHNVTDWNNPQIPSDDIAFIQYTSGSTSKPKGVLVTHANLLHNCYMLMNYFELSGEDILVNWLPHYHDMGLIGNIILNAYLGSHCYLMAPGAFVKKPITWLENMSKYGATYTGSPNFGYQLCVDKISDEQAAKLDLSRWRNAYCGSEPIRSTTMRAFVERFSKYHLRQEALYPCYGMAEATLIICGGKVNEAPKITRFNAEKLHQGMADIIVDDACEHTKNIREIVGCGKPHLGQEVKIVNPETFAVLPAGNVGEIWVSGPSVCSGYFNRPEQSAAIFSAKLDGDERKYVRSGDLGFMLADGELYISGRIKDLIIIRGRNHYPQDIELAVANCHPALQIDGGACFSIEDDGEERLVVTHEINRNFIKKYNFNEILAAVKSTVSELFEIDVSAFVLLRPGRVLKTSSGKIMRSATKALYIEESIDVVEQWINPQRELKQNNDVANNDNQLIIDFEDEEVVASWFAQKISLSQGIAVKDISYFTPIATFGLSSIQTMELLGNLSVAIGKEVEATLIWEYPTIDQLSRKVVSLGKNLAEGRG